MFKKTLLALSVAGAAFGAQAGAIYSTATNTAATNANFTIGNGGAGLAGEALGVIAGAAGNVLSTAGNCEVAATNLTGDLVANGFTNVAASNDDDVSVISGTDLGLFYANEKVTMTANDACKVALKTVVSASSAKSPVEQKGTVTVGAAIVAGLGGYRKEDTITINFTGAKIDPSVIPTLSTTASGANIVLLDITATTVRFTVDATADIPGNAILTLAGVKLNTTGLTSGSNVSIDTFATNTSGTKYDIIDATKIHELVPQYSATVKRKFDGIIDVSEDRKNLFTATGGSAVANDDNDGDAFVAKTDTMLIEVKRDATDNLVTAQAITFTLTGDFSWLASVANTSNDNVAVTNAEIATHLGAFMSSDAGATYAVTPGSVTLSSDQKTLTAKVTTATAHGTWGVKLVVPGKSATNPVINEQKYTIAAVVNDATASPNTINMTATSAVDAGEWKLNGSVVTIPYMPFDDNTAVIMRHTNTGVQTGDITVRYMLEGVDSNWISAGVVGQSSRGVKDIRDLVINAIKTKSGKVSGKAAIEITTNVPSDDVTVYAGFRVKDENDRGFVGTFGKHGSAK